MSECPKNIWVTAIILKVILTKNTATISLTIMCRHCIGRWAGRVKNMTPKVEKKDAKRKKYGRAKKRDQFNKKILNGAEVCNRTPNTSSMHHKNPRFITNSIEPANSYRQWIKILASPVNDTLDRKDDKIQHRSTISPAGYNIKFRTHTQKNKGATGKSIQKERNQAARIKVASALYGEDYELEL